MVIFRDFSGHYPWIGFNDTNDNDVFVWLNGEVLQNNDPYWRSGGFPHLHTYVITHKISLMLIFNLLLTSISRS